MFRRSVALVTVGAMAIALFGFLGTAQAVSSTITVSAATPHFSYVQTVPFVGKQPAKVVAPAVHTQPVYVRDQKVNGQGTSEVQEDVGTTRGGTVCNVAGPSSVQGNKLPPPNPVRVTTWCDSFSFVVTNTATADNLPWAVDINLTWPGTLAKDEKTGATYNADNWLNLYFYDDVTHYYEYEDNSGESYEYGNVLLLSNQTNTYPKNIEIGQIPETNKPVKCVDGAANGGCWYKAWQHKGDKQPFGGSNYGGAEGGPSGTPENCPTAIMDGVSGLTFGTTSIPFPGGLNTYNSDVQQNLCPKITKTYETHKYTLVVANINDIFTNKGYSLNVDFNTLDPGSWATDFFKSGNYYFPNGAGNLLPSFNDYNSPSGSASDSGSGSLAPVKVPGADGPLMTQHLLAVKGESAQVKGPRNDLDYVLPAFLFLILSFFILTVLLFWRRRRKATAAAT
ncbi:MAG: hypothetical protein ABR507_11980 [Actinomycetota bacterium]